jgi:hypothetical protein
MKKLGGGLFSEPLKNLGLLKPQSLTGS